MLAFIVAMDKNRVIGYKNDMPWHLPKDLQYFKERTTGHTIVMGRKTFESLGRVLPNRKHVVLTRTEANFPEEVTVLHSITSLLDYIEERKDEKIFIIGGGNLFSQMLPYVDRMYITEIDEVFEGDVYFPEFDKDEWKIISKEKGPKDQKNPYDYYYIVYERK
ncbi:MAG TPA: dihydrofolate reductase [Pseudogracilibacillus sp.]|nr:dihydrofolate reductase [Pseudogracilibacillus sp.]